MKHAAKHLAPRRRSSAAWFAAAGVLAATALTVAVAPAAQSAGSPTAPAFTTTRVLTRTHLDNGQDVEVDRRTVTVTVDRTKGLRDRQGIEVTWSGAHPTGGVVFDEKKPHAADQEYPVVILQCRGLDSTSVPAAQRLSQETCFTGTWDTRFFPAYRGAFPSPRLDRYATPAERTLTVGAPASLPASCATGGGYSRYVAFRGVGGRAYYNGALGCAGLAPEQSVVANPLNPASATWSRTLLDGTGSSRFVVQDDQDNASLGCSATVACSLVVIPVMGISCDVAASSLPAADQPPSGEVSADRKECESTGAYVAGAPNSDQKATSDPISKLAVNGRLWWSASNWRNRISVPLSFARTAASCSLTGGKAPLNIYGSQVVTQAVQQWAPVFCGSSSRFPLQQTETPEVQAKNLLANGFTDGSYLGVQGVFQAGPPAAPFTNPVVQAPTALSGWGIGFVVDNRQQKQVYTLRLNARLLAKLLSMSYPALVGVRDDWSSSAKWSRYRPVSHNPLNITDDPEFKALNPGLADLNNVPTWSTTTLYSLSSDTDVITALTSYIQADKEARAWLDGSPDPWGMEVNPTYRGISLPVTSWPLLDPYVSPAGSCAGQNEPLFPLVAGPVSSPDLLSFDLQYGISSSLVNCVQVGETVNDVRRIAEGPEDPGTRFILGVVSLADAQRFSIPLADLQTFVSSKAPDTPTDATGRSFAHPDATGLLKAARLLQPDDQLGTWTLPYSSLLTSDNAAAYPGTLLVSTDVPTSGLDTVTATRFATFLDFARGTGQVPGTANGQLAPGYLPLTSAGLSALTAYTRTAATAVRAQHGFVPKPSDPAAGPPAAPTGGGSTGTGGGAGATTGTTGTSDPTGGLEVGSTTTGAPPPTVAPPVRTPLLSAGSTARAPLGWTGNALPLLLLLALGCGALGLWTSGALTAGLRR